MSKSTVKNKELLKRLKNKRIQSTRISIYDTPRVVSGKMEIFN